MWWTWNAGTVASNVPPLLSRLEEQVRELVKTLKPAALRSLLGSRRACRDVAARGRKRPPRARLRAALAQTYVEALYARTLALQTLGAS